MELVVAYKHPHDMQVHVCDSKMMSDALMSRENKIEMSMRVYEYACMLLSRVMCLRSQHKTCLPWHVSCAYGVSTRHVCLGTCHVLTFSTSHVYMARLPTVVLSYV